MKCCIFNLKKCRIMLKFSVYNLRGYCLKARIKLASIIISMLLVLGVLVVGVLAASKTSVSLKGSVSFVANDVYCTVKGEIVGTKEDVSLPTLNFSSTDEPTGWESKNLTFSHKKTPIKINITIENLSKERSLYVDVVDAIEVVENIEKVIKEDGNEYKSGDIVELAKSTGAGTSVKSFTIEMRVHDSNYSINKVEYEYKLNLNNNLSSSNSIESYPVNCKFSSETFEYSAMTKSESGLIKGENVYQILSDGEIVAYIDFGKTDISKNITKGSKINITLYISFMSEAIILVNNNILNVDLQSSDYNYYTFEINVERDVNIEIKGDFFQI